MSSFDCLKSICRTFIRKQTQVKSNSCLVRVCSITLPYVVVFHVQSLRALNQKYRMELCLLLVLSVLVGEWILPVRLAIQSRAVRSWLVRKANSMASRLAKVFFADTYQDQKLILRKFSLMEYSRIGAVCKDVRNRLLNWPMLTVKNVLNIKVHFFIL